MQWTPVHLGGTKSICLETGLDDILRVGGNPRQHPGHTAPKENGTGALTQIPGQECQLVNLLLTPGMFGPNLTITS